MIQAGEFVSKVNSAFTEMVEGNIIAEQQFKDFEGLCEQKPLDEDVVGAFNSAEGSQLWLDRAQSALDLQTPEGTHLFRCSGYTSVIGSSGVLALHATLLHAEEPVVPDPIEKALNGETYCHMAIVKAARALADSKNSGIQWPTIGQASARDIFVGVSGALFMHGNDRFSDVRQALRDILPGIEAGPDDPEIFYLSGMADQIRAEAVLSEPAPITIESIAQRIENLVDSGVNVH